VQDLRQVVAEWVVNRKQKAIGAPTLGV
jgi:hypothetical protein